MKSDRTIRGVKKPADRNVYRLLDTPFLLLQALLPANEMLLVFDIMMFITVTASTFRGYSKLFSNFFGTRLRQRFIPFSKAMEFFRSVFRFHRHPSVPCSYMRTAHTLQKTGTWPVFLVHAASVCFWFFSFGNCP